MDFNYNYGYGSIGSSDEPVPEVIGTLSFYDGIVGSEYDYNI